MFKKLLFLKTWAVNQKYPIISYKGYVYVLPFSVSPTISAVSSHMKLEATPEVLLPYL